MTRGTRGCKVLELFSNFKWARTSAFLVDARSKHHPAACLENESRIAFTPAAFAFTGGAVGWGVLWPSKNRTAHQWVCSGKQD